MLSNILVRRVFVKPDFVNKEQMSRSSSSADLATLPSRAQLGIQRNAMVRNGSITLARLAMQFTMAGSFRASREKGVLKSAQMMVYLCPPLAVSSLSHTLANRLI